MRAILIDDDPDCNFVLEQLLKQYCPEVTILQTCQNTREGEHAIRQWKPDLVFLDVELPDGTGFDLLKTLMPADFQVIFVTGYDKYALQAIKFSAVDFLLKPVNEEELETAVEKANQRLQEHKKLVRYEFLLELVEGQKRQQKPNRILLPNPQHGNELVALDHINFLKADGAYTHFCLTDRRSIIVSKHVGSYEKELTEFSFFKVHRSYLVNLNLVRFFNRGEDELIMQNGEKIPVSRSVKEELIRLL